MNNSIDSIDINSTQQECNYCSTSNVLMSSNFRDKQYLLYFQNDNITLFESDDFGASVLDELIINYCPMCGREL